MDTPADKTTLEDLINDTNDLVESDYTPESWSIFTTALEEANIILNDNNATQAQVNSAADALADAINNLEPMAEEEVPEVFVSLTRPVVFVE